MKVAVAVALLVALLAVASCKAYDAKAGVFPKNKNFILQQDRTLFEPNVI